MSRYLHTLSAVLFYLLGSSAFLAYVLWHNGVAVERTEAWLAVVDLPLLFIGALYGGLSVERSLRDGNRPSLLVGILVALPLLAVCVLFAALNFWNLVAR